MGSATDGQQFRVSPDTVYNILDDQSVLINVRTNELYELNRTGTRFWELLSAGHNRAQIRQLMLQEFDVDEVVLDREIDSLVASLQDAGLIASNY
jgi:hypothetical protein